MLCIKGALDFQGEPIVVLKASFSACGIIKRQTWANTRLMSRISAVKFASEDVAIYTHKVGLGTQSFGIRVVVHSIACTNGHIRDEQHVAQNV